MDSFPLSAESRRAFFKKAAIAAAAVASPFRLPMRAAETIQLPFDNGERPLITYPQKRPLIRLTTRPPQLETPFSIFNEGAVTPNDAFFVRYHLTQSPPAEERLAPETFRLSVGGKVRSNLSLSVADLKTQFEAVQLTAVCQCSGNSRGFFQPRIPGGQSGNGMMGNARWKGARLKDVLAKAGVDAGVRQVTFNGLDAPLLPQTPDFVKALDIDHALTDEPLLAYEMNGEALPWLNGYPLRLVVPGYYGTYWMKHVHEIQAVDSIYTGYWMSTAYRIPDNACACVPPGTKPDKTIPINRLNVRSFITSVADGAAIKAGEILHLRGIAFDGGRGIREALLSDDGGATWFPATLGKDLGKYSFREWSASYRSKAPGKITLKVKAANIDGDTQPLDPRWNPSGYMRNVVETLTLEAK